MGVNRNIGSIEALKVYGNPGDFRKLIDNHGQLCKIKQSLPCPHCLGANHGVPDYNCTICNGRGYLYTYQRRFLVADELSPCNRSATEFYPYYYPVLDVVSFQRVIDERQGGITSIPVLSVDEEAGIVTIASGQIREYEANRISYFFDGWTKVTGDVLKCDADHGLMWPTKTRYNTGYQSSNPLEAEADISQIIRIYNSGTGRDIENFKLVGNTIQTTDTVVPGKMVADYYYADLTPIITADLRTKDDLEEWSNNMTSGDIRMALFPWWNVAKGDIVTIAADAQFYNEMLVHRSDLDMLFQIECFEIDAILVDEDGVTYHRDVDYILDGLRYIRWISDNQPKKGKVISVRVGYKPSFIVFEDNVERNNLENRRYPSIIMAKHWTKTNKDDIEKLLNIQI